MTKETLNTLYDAADPHSWSRLFKAFLLTVSGILMFSCLIVANEAWSYDYTADDFESRQVYKVSPSSVDSSCISLLKTNQTLSSKASTIRNQRSAGKVAALGMLLGARFALEPQENTAVKASYDKSAPDYQKTRVSKNRSALAIAAFRKCQKEQALEQLARAD